MTASQIPAAQTHCPARTNAESPLSLVTVIPVISAAINGVQRENPPHHHITRLSFAAHSTKLVFSAPNAVGPKNAAEYRPASPRPVRAGYNSSAGQNTGHAAQKHQSGGKINTPTVSLMVTLDKLVTSSAIPVDPCGRSTGILYQSDNPIVVPHPDPQHHQPAAGLCGIAPPHPAPAE